MDAQGRMDGEAYVQMEIGNEEISQSVAILFSISADCRNLSFHRNVELCEMTKRYKRAFIQNMHLRFAYNEIQELADEIVQVCAGPIWDDMAENADRFRFEGHVVQKMTDYDPENDIIVAFGDPLIFALMVMYASSLSGKITLARYSQRSKRYIIREVTDGDFEAFEETEIGNG